MKTYEKSWLTQRFRMLMSRVKYPLHLNIRCFHFIPPLV